VTAEEMLKKKIQQRENLFAELLAEEVDSVLLAKIWSEIQMLRQQLKELINGANNEAANQT
jgi:methyl coenzyme M reductase beta subunit